MTPVTADSAAAQPFPCDAGARLVRVIIAPSARPGSTDSGRIICHPNASDALPGGKPNDTPPDLFFDERTGALLVNEVNTIPGLTEVSVFPKVMRAAGWDYPKLLTELTRLAVEA
ncbi:hypothetical protein ACFVH4_15655 [Nocardia ignorata]|uniref:hypothetical protein n=1 Tax=Nocardia ignorata TaxID=145285 RepID=UPI00362B979E